MTAKTSRRRIVWLVALLIVKIAIVLLLGHTETVRFVYAGF